VQEPKPATAARIPDLLGLVAQYWSFEGIAGFDAHRLSRQLERLCEQPHLGGAWITYDDHAPAGYLLSVYVFSLEHHGLTAEIDELFVLPQHRDRGLGAQLLRAAEAAATAAGCTNISLQLGRDNEAARAFYRRHDYRARAGYELLDKSLPAA
jgi:ribosomal protein S18 acetylase RimI-like enzyme